MADDKDIKVENLNNLTPEKVIQSVRSELKQEKLKSYKTKFKEILKRHSDAQDIVDNIKRELEALEKEFYVTFNNN